MDDEILYENIIRDMLNSLGIVDGVGSTRFNIRMIVTATITSTGHKRINELLLLRIFLTHGGFNDIHIAHHQANEV